MIPFAVNVLDVEEVIGAVGVEGDLSKSGFADS